MLKFGCNKPQRKFTKFNEVSMTDIGEAALYQLPRSRRQSL